MQQTTVRPSETEALCSNEFTSFPEGLAKECHMYHVNKANALKIYNSKDKSAISNSIPTCEVIDLSVVISAKAAMAAPKTFKQSLLKWHAVFRIYLPAAPGKSTLIWSYFDMPFKTVVLDSTFFSLQRLYCRKFF